MIHARALSRDGAAKTPSRLDLPPPQDLPAELVLAPEDIGPVRAILTEFLAALADEDAARRPARIRALLVTIGPGDARVVETEATTIPAGKGEVEDFDRYFGVRRIEEDQGALALLRGMLQVSAAVLDLAARGPDLPQEALSLQVAGFAAYARLLARLCGLGKLP
ncbi:MAG: hypothetical protein ACK5MQ_07405 [Pikeienuella sp.]